MNEEFFFAQVSLAVSLAYLFFMLYMLRHATHQPYNIKEWPMISLLIPFRNEEHNLEACCQALQKLNYPADKLEILLLNDSSTDGSLDIINPYLQKNPLFKLVNVESEQNNLRGKMNVLAQGIQKSDAEFIFITDADCQPHTNWLQTMLTYFDKETALISGFTLICSAKPNSSKLFEKLQTIDWIFLQSLAHGASKIKRPITVIGNNIAFKRQVYNDLGGYVKIGFSITEDHALMQAILDRTNYNVKYICAAESPVYSNPLANFSDFMQQRLRWTKGGLKGRPFAFILVGFSFLVHLLIPLIFIFGPYNMIAATAIGLIIGIDYFQLKRYLKFFNLESLKKDFVKYEVFFILYTLLLFILLPIPKKIDWKGRKY
jgi:cellulose synthase/poly-beta-1,6-N-acetylglucosamine synthase-like glycosyltransferase